MVEQPALTERPARRTPLGPVQSLGEVLSLKQVGSYFHLVLIADAVATRFRPGSFVALGIGGETSGLLQRRPFWVHRVRTSGVYGGTVEVVFAVRGAGTRWLAQRQPHDSVSVLGPLGRPFALPQEPVSCVVVGHGYGAAGLFTLAERLGERGCSVHMVLGGSTGRELFGALEARRATQSVTVTTADGSVGIKGAVTDVLPALLARSQAEVVYACGPLAMLRGTAELARAAGAWSQVAMEAPMACGTGVCLSCVVPVRGKDGIARPARCCVDGPVFAGDRVDWALL